MYLTEETEITSYTRVSKLGKEHNYTRVKRVVVFRCDNCGQVFRRDRGNMSPRRLSNNYFHCCSECDSKRFAQHKGVDRRTMWDKPASSLDDISKL
jgi:predicted RNA-binding Zn-ribbon protein involved in translation (DUF1610 family)